MDHLVELTVLLSDHRGHRARCGRSIAMSSRPVVGDTLHDLCPVGALVVLAVGWSYDRECWVATCEAPAAAQAGDIDRQREALGKGWRWDVAQGAGGPPWKEVG